jgi:SnoaL-like domain
MTEHSAAATVDQPAWSVEMFAQFWSNPDPALVPPTLTEDVVGHWPGRDEPVRGREEYTRCIAAAVDALPDMYLEVAEHAQSGEFFFVRWILHATRRARTVRAHRDGPCPGPRPTCRRERDRVRHGGVRGALGQVGPVGLAWIHRS